MKIQLKRSNVLDGGSAKQPTAGQMEYGELAVNYSQEDPAIFLKDANDNIIRIAGGGADGAFDGDYESLTNKPTIGDGSITINNADGSENATFTVNQTGPTIVTLPEGFSGDYDDLENLPTIGNGTITIKSGGTEVGTFTVNQEGTTDIDIPAASWGDIDEKPIYIDTSEPGTPNNGDLWVDLNECPPELKIWSDCSGTGQWEGIEGTPALTVITPVLSGNPAEGEVLTSTLGQAVGGKEPFTYVYNFQDENDNVLQATATNTYTLVNADVGKTVTVTVTATDSRGTVETSSKSNAIGPVVPPETVNAPTLITPADGATDVSNTSVTLSCSAYSGVASVYGTTKWEVSSASDFSVLVYNVTNTNETSTVASFNLAFETTYYARCKHTSSTGIASDYSNINSFETQADPVDPNVPSGEMSGLRFDTQRLTGLKRTTNIGSAWTLSAWVKLTSPTDFTIASQVDTTGIIMARPDGTFFYCGHSTTTPYPLNTWHHLVVAVNGNQVKIYVDGNLDSDVTVGSAWSNLPLNIGLSPSASAANRSAYLSEFFFAEEVLPATVFGKTFPDGRWGPLTSDEIKDNINNYPKLPKGVNTSQVWSDDLSTNSTILQPVTNAFDGSLSTNFEINSFTPAAEWQLSREFTGVNKLELLGEVTGSSPGVTYTISGDGITTTTWENGGALKIEVPLTSTTINNLKVTAPDTTSGVRLAAIWINGILLVDDGFWNSSQNWSANTSVVGNLNPGLTMADLFDGNTATGAVGAGPSETNTFTATFDPALNVTTGLKLYFDQANRSYAINQTTGDGDTPPAGAALSTVSGWNDVSFTGSLTSIHFFGNNSANFSPYCAGIEVNGALLVDSGATWNTSEVWSQYIDNARDGDPVQNGFNGDTSNGAISDNTVINWNTSLSAVTSFEIQLRPDVIGEAASFEVAGTGLTTTTVTGGKANTLVSIPVTSSSVSNVSVTTNDLSKSGPGICQIVVNNEVLVDKASFGANGFYLPFDPTNTGANYSSDWTYLSEVAVNPDTSISGIFNGDYGNDGRLATISYGGAGSLTLYPTGSILGKVQIRIRNGATPSNITYEFSTDGSNYTPVTTLAQGGTGYWMDLGDLTITPANGLIIKMTCSSGNSEIDIRGLMIDDVVLIDHNSIGVDASGNQNNFHDQNFITSINSNQPWEDAVEATTNGPLLNEKSIFDGNLTTFGATTTADLSTSPGTLTFTPTTPITVNKSLKIYVYDHGNVQQGNPAQPVYASMTYKVNANTAVDYQSNSQGHRWVDTGFTGTLTSLAISGEKSNIPGGSTTGAIELGAIEIDGAVLSNKYNSLDTVTDTPLMNYAVMENASNGNLVSNGILGGTSLTYLGESGVTYYFERDGVGEYQEGGTSWDTSGNGQAFNFGQQPFAASNIISYDRATGVVTLPLIQPYDQRANTSQVWSTSLTTTGAWARGPEEAFKNEGNTNSASANDPGIVTFDISSNPLLIGGGITIVVATNGSPARTVTLNGTEVTGPFDSNWNELALNVGSETELTTLEFSGAVGLGSITVNGRLLIDQGVWDASQNWSDYMTTDGTFDTSAVTTRAYDGNMDYYADTTESGKTITTTFPGGLDYTSKVEVFVRQRLVSASINGGAPVQVNGDDLTFAWADVVTGSGTMNSLEIIADSGHYCGFAGVRVDGAILVDAGPTWNTSQVWSVDNTAAVGFYYSSSGYYGGPENAFNGSLNNYCLAGTGVGAYDTGVYAPSSPIPFNTLKICVEQEGTGSLFVNTGSGLTDVTAQLIMSGNKGVYTTSTSGTLTSLEYRSTAEYNYCALGSVEINGSILVDGNGGEYNTLFQTWDEWATLGLFFFNENTGRTITAFELKRKYGLTAAAPDAGIYNLTFQPRARVFEYLKQATAYLPLEDLMPQLEATQASLVATQADLDTAQAALNEATEALAENLTTRSAMQVSLDSLLTRLSGLESDEIVDDATDTTLLTAFAALVARVEALENP